MGVLGGLAARREHHARVCELLGVERPASTWSAADFYADALACLASCGRRGLLVGAVGNTPAEAAELLRDHVDLIGSSAALGRREAGPAFFERLIDEAGVDAAEIAYVGDRVDNDVVPALAAGMVAVHIRRGPVGVPPRAAGRGAFAFGRTGRAAGALGV